MKKLFVIFYISFCLLALIQFGKQSGENRYGERVAAAPHDTHTLFLPILNYNYNLQFPAPLFGMQVYGSTEQNSTYYPYLINSQTSWVRSNVFWLHVEPENRDPANFSWAGTDDAIAAARADNGGLHLIVTIGVIPEWARLNPEWVDGPIHPDALGEFAEFVQAVVERYDGDGYLDAPGSPIVRHWELINEPDAGQNRWGYYGAEYAEMLRTVYPVIKQADPAAQVVFGGIAYDYFESQGGTFVESFFDDVLAAGGGAYFDIMNFHMYPLFAPNWGHDSTGMKGKADILRAKLAAYGYHKPFVITEAGWHNSTDAVPPSNNNEQVDRLVQLVAHSFATDIKVMIWWMLYDPGDFLPNYGLVTRGSTPTPKDAYTAYRAAVALLNNAQFVRTLPPTETGTTLMEAHQFRTDTGSLYIAWLNPYGTTETRPLSIPTASLTILDGMGNLIGTAVDSDNDGYVTVTITTRPVYIQVNH